MMIILWYNEWHNEWYNENNDHSMIIGLYRQNGIMKMIIMFSIINNENDDFYGIMNGIMNGIMKTMIIL